MFKTKEELKGAEPYHPDEFDSGCHIGRENAVDDCFESFKERVEFYKKYRLTYEEDTSGMVFLSNDQPDAYEEYRKSGFDYNLWLFDYCFGDIE